MVAVPASCIRVCLLAGVEGQVWSVLLDLCRRGRFCAHILLSPREADTTPIAGKTPGQEGMEQLPCGLA